MGLKKQPLRPVGWLRHLWLMPLLWSLIGLVFIFESSLVMAAKRYNDPFLLVKQQAVWLILSLVGFGLIKRLNWRFLKHLSPWLMGVNLVMLLLVFVPFIGVKAGGAYRWLNLGLFRLQPSEVLKLSFTLYLSYWLTSQTRRFVSFITLTAIIIGGLVLIEPDLSTSLLIITSAGLIYFLQAKRVKPFFIFSLILLIVSLLLIILSPYRLQRLKTLINPYQDRLGSAYQINQIIIALGRGGLWGQGLGGSQQRYLYLPAASTDAIMAVIGEETGFLGLSLLLMSYLVFLSQPFKLAGRLGSGSRSLFLYGTGLIIFLQMMINLGGMVAILPLTGMPLPFISYGGSSLLTLWLLIGAAQAALDSA